MYIRYIHTYIYTCIVCEVHPQQQSASRRYWCSIWTARYGSPEMFELWGGGGAPFTAHDGGNYLTDRTKTKVRLLARSETSARNADREPGV